MVHESHTSKGMRTKDILMRFLRPAWTRSLLGLGLDDTRRSTPSMGLTLLVLTHQLRLTENEPA